MLRYVEGNTINMCTAIYYICFLILVDYKQKIASALKLENS